MTKNRLTPLHGDPAQAPVTAARQLAGPALVAALRESRQRTLSLVQDLNPAQWSPARQIGINPVAWELAHVAWFAEFWTLRGPHQCDAQGQTRALHPPRFTGPDALFDSAQLAHDQRWVKSTPSRAAVQDMLSAQLEASLAVLTQDGTAPDLVSDKLAQDSLYFHRLALFHEDMHGEAFCWMRATLGYPVPAGMDLPQVSPSRPLALAGTYIFIGAKVGTSDFVFDNEAPAAAVQLHPYEIDSAPVSAGQFSRFVAAGGYDQPDFWPDEAGRWRTGSSRSHPQHWRRSPQGDWQIRWFDQWRALDDNAPAIQLNAYEAEAYCRWAGRRLPRAAEWEHAAKTQLEFDWGNSVWEWTSDAFGPYPGFVPGPYREYSQPWFGNHRELRGGAFATQARLQQPHYRNFFQPQRTDLFTGFRSVAL
ncbi:MAG: ergothioneine biosynthesis protein EgtB [Rhodoferax sp.]|jgi:iron(II)-dependent oxidoreductase